MFAYRYEFWHRGVRHQLAHAWQAEQIGGRRLSGGDAERVLAALMRGGDEHSIRSAYQAFAEAHDLRGISNHQVLLWFSAALGSEPGAIGPARLVLVELDSSGPLVSQPRIARPQNDAERLAARCIAVGIRDLFHRGESYRLAVDPQLSPSRQTSVAQALQPEQAASLLTEIVANAATPVATRELLREVARFMTSTSRPVGSAALVLRPFARGGAAAGKSPEPPPSAPSQRSTPSQLRRAALPTQETLDWVEIRLVDDGGQAIAAHAFAVTFVDGSTREGNLDDSGTAYLDGVPSGPCVVEFPGFGARVLN